jgi:hypothetical protein
METVLTTEGNEITCEGHLRVVMTMDDGVVTGLKFYGLNDAGEVDVTIDAMKLPEFYPSLGGSDA